MIPVYLANARFLAGYRRAGLGGRRDVLDAVRAACHPAGYGLSNRAAVLSARLRTALPPRRGCDPAR
jgi:hypothetical protein